MAELAETVVASTSLVSRYKIVLVTATIGATSDTIVLLQSQTGIQSIAGILGAVITGGMDADFQALQVSFSDMTITIVSKQADGAASDEFTGTTVSIAVLGNM